MDTCSGRPSVACSVFSGLQLSTCEPQATSYTLQQHPYNASRRMLLQRAQAQLAAPAQARTRMCAPRMHKLSKRSLVVTAAAQPEEPTSSTSAPPSLQAQLQTFVNKYESNALSSGVGALAVTGWCVAHGQDPATAAGISVMSVVVALVSLSCGGLFARSLQHGVRFGSMCCRVQLDACHTGISMYACCACALGSTYVLPKLFLMILNLTTVPDAAAML
jgi:hypothetical protein